MVDRTFNDAKYTKRAPLDTDTFPMQATDSVDGTNHGTKGTNIKAWLKVYNDGLYHPKFNNSDDITEGSTNLFMTAQHRADIQANNDKVTNQTHSGDVAGATTLTIQQNAVTNTKIQDQAVTVAKLNPGGTTPDNTKFYRGDGTWQVPPQTPGGSQNQALMYACSDETTALTTGVKLTARAPYGFTISAIRCTLTTAGSSNTVVRVTDDNTNISPDITIASGTKFGNAASITNPNMADNSEIIVNIVTAGTGATGLKVHIVGQPS